MKLKLFEHRSNIHENQQFNDLLLLYSYSVLYYVGYRPPAVALQDTLFSVSNLHLKVINQGEAAY